MVETMRILGLSLVLVLVLGLGSCGGGGSFSPAQQPEAPSLAELQELLNAELLRLGRDPGASVSATPGAGNEVFDLASTPAFLDGESVPSGVVLSWTDRLLGDFDNNGQVSSADLTPLGLNFLQTVAYREPAEALGLSFWPFGDPEDDGGNPPPASLPPDSGAANWMRARVDGNADGVISTADLTSIALNWRCRVDGYRVYVRKPGSETFEMLLPPADPAAEMTSARSSFLPQVDGQPLFTRPVRFRHTYYFGLPGVYEFYLASYDSSAAAEGPRSRSVFVDSSSGDVVPNGLKALLSAQPLSGIAPLTVDFDASLSSGHIVRFDWDLDGDGNFELNSGEDPTVSRTYEFNQSVSAAVRVLDNLGNTATATVGINIASPAGNQPPLAALIADQTQGPFPLKVEFDASGSLDPDGQIIKHEWDFDGDGTFDINSGTIPFVSFVYRSNASNTAKVRITDNEGGFSIGMLNIIVESPGGNQPPLAALSALPTSGVLPLLVNFDASGSLDIDGQIVRHDWDFDGDGVIDLSTGTSGQASFTYNNNATYLARVTVEDDDGATAQATAPIAVQSPGGNAPPLAAVTASPAFGNAPLNVSFDASGSIDLDGTIVKHEWDFDGDGIYDQNTGTIPLTTHLYTQSALTTARLLLTDDDNGTALATIEIDTLGVQTGGEPPAVVLSADPLSGQVAVSEDPPGTFNNDGLDVDFTAQASDSDGSVVKYEWDFDGDGIFNFTSDDDPTVTNNYKLTGIYEVRVRVLDNEGNSTVSAPLEISVENRAPFPKLTRSPQLRNGDTALETPVEITYSAQQSVDLDGQILRYEWDLDGDGQFNYDADGLLLAPDIDTGLQGFISQDYDDAGASPAVVGVKVTDSSGDDAYVDLSTELKDEYDEIEGNDIVSQSTLLDAQSGANAYSANIGGQDLDGYDADDVDWFAFTIDGCQRFDLSISGVDPLQADLNLRLYDSDGSTLLASSLKTGVLDSINDFALLSQKTLFVKVNRFSSSALTDYDYTLNLNLEALPLSESEDNDTKATADEIAAGQFAPNGHLLNFFAAFETSGNQNDDSDWFTWSTDGGVDFYVNLFFKHSDADLDIYLLDENGTTVAASTSVTDNEFITNDQLLAGTYFLRVKRSGGGHCCYQLDVLGGGVANTYPIVGDADEACGTDSGYNDNSLVKFVRLSDSAEFTTTTDAMGQGDWTLELANGIYSFVDPGNFLANDGGGQINCPGDNAYALPFNVEMINGELYVHNPGNDVNDPPHGTKIYDPDEANKDTLYTYNEIAG